MSARLSQPSPTLRGRWLLAARAAWVVFGVAAAVVGVLSTIFTVGVTDSLPPEEVSRKMLSLLLMDTFMLSVPIAIGIAVLRSRLFDIDVVINRTLVYASLTATLVGLYFGGIVVLQRVFVALTGQKWLAYLCNVKATELCPS